MEAELDGDDGIDVGVEAELGGDDGIDWEVDHKRDNIVGVMVVVEIVGTTMMKELFPGLWLSQFHKMYAGGMHNMHAHTH